MPGYCDGNFIKTVDNASAVRKCSRNKKISLWTGGQRTNFISDLVICFVIILSGRITETRIMEYNYEFSLITRLLPSFGINPEKLSKISRRLWPTTCWLSWSRVSSKLTTTTRTGKSTSESLLSCCPWKRTFCFCSVSIIRSSHPSNSWRYVAKMLNSLDLILNPKFCEKFMQIWREYDSDNSGYVSFSFLPFPIRLWRTFSPPPDWSWRIKGK